MNEKMKWILFLIVLFVVIRLLGKLHLIPTFDSINAEKLGKNTTGDAPSVHSAIDRAIKDKDTALSTSEVTALAKTIYDAKSITGDNDNAALDALRSLANKTQLYQLKKLFNALFNADLMTYLNFMDYSNMVVANGIINKLK